jgi:hypothetical protein
MDGGNEPSVGETERHGLSEASIVNLEFADRLRVYWQAATVSMQVSQGGGNTIGVHPMFVDDLRAAEALARVAAALTMLADLAIKR